MLRWGGWGTGGTITFLLQGRGLEPEWGVRLPAIARLVSQAQA